MARIESPGNTFQARNTATGARSAVLLCSFLSVMFSIEASDAERLVKITWSGKVDSDEMRRCAEEIGVTASKMRPGFRVLVDMTDLQSMDSAGAPYIGSIMDLCVIKQVEHVVRVIPDPHKDIGLNIMSYFRYGSKIRVTICENLADAMRRLA
jgi:anti-anti-sigma regulatory factor